MMIIALEIENIMLTVMFSLPSLKWQDELEELPAELD